MSAWKYKNKFLKTNLWHAKFMWEAAVKNSNYLNEESALLGKSP